MDLPHIDWATFGTFAGGAATTLLARGLGIHQRLVALERSRDVQAELIANLTSELALSREKLARTDAELQRVTRMLLAERRVSKALTERVAQLEQERDAADRRAKAAAEELATAKRMGLPSHDTMPPPGGKSR